MKITICPPMPAKGYIPTGFRNAEISTFLNHFSKTEVAGLSYYSLKQRPRKKA